MATRKPKPLPEDLPAVDALPPLPLDHPVLHTIINQYVGGTSKATATTRRRCWRLNPASASA